MIVIVVLTIAVLWASHRAKQYFPSRASLSWLREKAPPVDIFKYLRWVRYKKATGELTRDQAQRFVDHAGRNLSWE